jgi:NADH:ubiquinone oxidoreductase subunit F (NADH-binding)
MLPKNSDRESVLHLLEEEGGLRPGAVERVHRKSGVPQADIYGVATFYHLLAEPDAGVRVCQGLSCRLAGSEALLADLAAVGTPATYASCLGLCDQAPARWDRLGTEAQVPRPAASPSHPDLAIDLMGQDTCDYQALRLAGERGFDWVLEEVPSAGLQGRGGAGFPAHIKWRGVLEQAETERYVVLNADEGEPGTFKDREVMLRRPHLVLEGLAIAARGLGAKDIYLYLRGEFGPAKASLRRALKEARACDQLADDLHWHFVDGHGAYICGEETALLEALEGKRGMPRMKPPFPVERGFRGKPTLIQNVETIACVPAILRQGGTWFKDLGKSEAGSKLYCISGHVAHPGVYEAPLGIPFRQLLEMAGGPLGKLKAFSPGGASSGFLPASKIDIAMDFSTLQKEGSMLGSAGAVVLNESTDMVEAALIQAVFFEDESCGQCAPCRIGTQVIRQALERYQENHDPRVLEHLKEVTWGMGEASICGLGQAAFYPLRSAMRYFPEEFAIGKESGQ